MRLETFFERFDQFADAPDAVAKMRNFILGLAFKGELSSETAEAGALPVGWNQRTIASIASSITPGFACSRSNEVEGGHVHLRTHNISKLGTLNFDLLIKINPRLVDPQKQSILRGDILFNNTNSQELVGKTCIVDRDYNYGFSNHITRIRVCEGIEPRFVVFYLTWLRNCGHFANICTRWINQAAVNTNALKGQQIPLPSLRIQRLIVAKIDELMALCDRLEAQQKEREERHVVLSRAAIARFDEAPTPANLSLLFHGSYSVEPTELRKAVFNMAIQGKLVPQAPSEGNAIDLIQQVEKVSDKNRKIRFKPIAEGDFPFAIPDTWAWTRLGNLALNSDAGWSPQCDSGPRQGTEWGVLKVSAVSWGRFLPNENKALPIGVVPRYEYEVRDGDFLLSRANTEELVARSVVVKAPPSHLMMSDKIVRFAFSPAIDTDFINLVNLADFAREYYGRNASGTSSSMKNVSRETICSLPVPLPPTAEQKRIVARVDQLLRMVDQLEAQIVSSIVLARDLLDAVIHELLHTSADAIESPANASNRAAIGCYAIQRLKENRSFGHTMNMKVVYLAQAHIGLRLDLQFERQAAGPWHPWIEEFDAMGQREGWFTVSEKPIGNDRTKYEYVPKASLKQKAAEAVAVLGKRKAEFDRLLNLFAERSTEEAEIIATLFAAWNDFLIDGKSPTDNEIIHEVRENWHMSKQRFTPSRLESWLQWLRDHRLVPQGRPPRTRQQLTLGLN